jgi:hypothetical protein
MQYGVEKRFVDRCEKKLGRPLSSEELSNITLCKLRKSPRNKREVKHFYYEALGWAYPYDGTTFRQA